MHTDFEREHEEVFKEATAIFKDRSTVRGQMWLEFPPSDKLRMIEEKLARAKYAYDRLMEHTVEFSPNTVVGMTKEFEDSLLDLMNFANFAIKQVRRGQSG